MWLDHPRLSQVTLKKDLHLCHHLNTCVMNHRPGGGAHAFPLHPAAPTFHAEESMALATGLCHCHATAAETYFISREQRLAPGTLVVGQLEGFPRRCRVICPQSSKKMQGREGEPLRRREEGGRQEEEEKSIVLVLLGGQRGCVESCISVLGLHIRTAEATGTQTQDVDAPSAGHFF